MKCTVIGLGEAGARYATALAAQGHTVWGVDPADHPTPAGVTRSDSLPSAVSQSDVVLVMTGAAAASAICRASLGSLTADTVYADFTSSAPRVMEELGELAGTTGARFADVAILGPVILHGVKTPLMASGPGARTVAEIIQPLGATVDVLDAPAGAAMAHKLLRSVFMKGLSTVTWEAVEAGRAAGYEPWIRDQIARQLAGDGHAVIERLLKGSHLHAERRAREMHDTASYLADLGVPPEMSRATEAALQRIATLDEGLHS